MTATSPCPTCNDGEVSFFHDYADSRGEHMTREVPCPACFDWSAPVERAADVAKLREELSC
jgi:DNA-directed RNA polymerase subunit M/transcription elongation factor TFIIS